MAANSKAHISFKLSEQDKTWLRKAARSQGITLSRFVLKAVLNYAQQCLPRDETEYRPDFDAQRTGPKGYEGQGWKLAWSVESELKKKYSSKQARDRMEWLMETLEKRDVFDTYIWFERWLPHVIKKVPEKKHRPYLNGFRDALKRIHGPD